MTRRGLVVAVLSVSACYGQINVFYTGRMLGYFRFPDQQDFTMKECPSDLAKMNDAGKGLYSLWQTKRPTGLLVGMGDTFAPDFFSRSFTGTSPDGSPVPYPAKDRYTWDQAKMAWIPDTEDSPTANHSIPADNVACFIRQMGYAALVPGKHDFTFGPERLMQLALFLYQKGAGPTLLAGNLSVATTVPEAKPRLPLYEVNRKLEKAQEAAHATERYTVLPLVNQDPASRDDPSPAVKFPDVVLPTYRRFGVDNAYFVMGGPNRVIAGDRTDQRALRRVSVAAGTIFATPAVTLPLAGATFRFYDDKTGDFDFKQRLAIRLRIDGLEICDNTTETLAHPACQQVPPAITADDDDYQTARINFEAPSEFLLPDHNYAACLHVVKSSFGTAKVPDYYCQPFYVAKPFLGDEVVNNAHSPRNPYAFVAPSSTASMLSATLPARPKLGDPYVIQDVLRTDQKMTKVAIFGLLDPDLQGNIGRLNYGWLNENDTYETTAQISSLTDALSQAMMHCSLDEACKYSSTHKILLAQMSAAKAIQLLANVKKPIFELIVTETDGNNKTVDGSVVRTVPQDNSPKFVVVPDQLFSATRNAEDRDTMPVTPLADLYSPGTISFQIHQAKVESAPGGKSTTKWTLTNSLNKPASPNPTTLGLPQITLPAACPSSALLKDIATRTLMKEGVSGPMASWSSTQVLQRLALFVMQQDDRQVSRISHHADISLIQSRDLFRPEIYGQTPISNCNLQEVLDRLFWKGDYAVRVPITGATLTSILKASDTFATQEANPTNIDLEKGRSLVKLGVFKDGADQNLTVNGFAVDPSKAYGTIMTDYLALADTGYTDLKTPIVPYPYRIKDFKQFDSISAMICRTIKKDVLSDAQCYQVESSAEDHLDSSNNLPSDETKGLVAGHVSASYLSPASRWSRFTGLYRGQNAAEIASANKPFWSFDLEKSDFGLNFSRPASSAVLKNQFSGITTAPVTAPVTYAMSFDDRMRLKFSTSTVDWFLQQEANWAYTRTGGTSFTRNLNPNTAAAETGVLWHVLWRNRRTIGRRQPQELDLLGAFRIESQVQAPRGDFNLSDQNSSILLGALRRPIDMFGKAGFRYSDDRSWFEAGYLGGRSLLNPTNVIFQNGATVAQLPLITGSIPLEKTTDASGNTIFKAPSPTAPFSTQLMYYSSPQGQALITAQDTFYATYQARPISGFFVNFSLNTPLPFGSTYSDWAGGKPIALLIENSGKWLFDFHDDLSTQTKYYDKLAWSIALPSVGNLSFKPEIDLTYFRNKSQQMANQQVINQQTSFSFHSVTYLATFSYTFSWRQGEPLSRLWRYATPAPTTSVPASGR